MALAIAGTIFRPVGKVDVVGLDRGEVGVYLLHFEADGTAPEITGDEMDEVGVSPLADRDLDGASCWADGPASTCGRCKSWLVIQRPR
jgi:hypothetical protein